MAINDFWIENGTLIKYKGRDEHVVIPDGVTSIGDKAFRDCSSLTSIVIPDSVTSISDSAFQWCSSLTSIIIPDGVTSIGNYAFSSCSNLTSIVIPDGVTSIGDYAFWGCRSLASIVIPDSVLHIGWYVFKNCSSLTNIVLPDSISYIGKNHIEGCDKLQLLQWPSGSLVDASAEYKRMMVKGFLCNPSAYSEEKRAEYLKYINGQKKKLLPELVQDNNVAALSNCEQIGLKLPSDFRDELIDLAANEKKTEALAWLMDYKNRTADRKKETADKERTEEQQFSNPYMAKLLKADWNWSKLEDGTIRIDKYKGSETDIVVPPVVGKMVVTAIGKQAFYGLNIMNITLPASITFIGEDAFSRTPWIKKQTTFVVANGILLKYTGKDTDVLLPDEVKSIGDGAFAGCDKLTNIALTENITHIGSKAFYGCTSLSSITFPSRITGIETEAFAYCKSLTDISIPDSVTYVRERAFVGCVNLCSVTLPDSVTAIGRHAFRGCNHLTALHASPAICSLAEESKAFTDNLKGVTAVVTGQLFTSSFYNKTDHNVYYQRTEVEALIEEYGGCVSKKVTPEITCLVTNGTYKIFSFHYKEAVERSIADAKSMGVEILTLEAFFMKYFPEGTPD